MENANLAPVGRGSRNRISSTLKMSEMEQAEIQLKGYLTRHQMKDSRGRRKVLQALMSAGRHVTTEELHAEIKQAGEQTGIATVYRALNLFCHCGLAERRQFGDGQARYEFTYQVKHHDHLICTGCHTIIEFKNLEIERLQKEVAQKHHFMMDHHKMEIYGLCKACAASLRRHLSANPETAS